VTGEGHTAADAASAAAAANRSVQLSLAGGFFSSPTSLRGMREPSDIPRRIERMRGEKGGRAKWGTPRRGRRRTSGVAFF